MTKLIKPLLYLISIILLLSSINAESQNELVVKTIYFKSLDIQNPSEQELEAYRRIMVDAQKYYADEMERHGFGRKTFSLDINEDGDVNISVVEGSKKIKEYTSINSIENDLSIIDRISDIQVVFLAGGSEIEGKSGIAYSNCINNECLYMSIIPTEVKNLVLPLVCHEVGHNLGLLHNKTENSLMFSSVNRFGVENEHKPGRLLDFEARAVNSNEYISEMGSSQNEDLQLRGYSADLISPLKIPSTDTNPSINHDSKSTFVVIDYSGPNSISPINPPHQHISFFGEVWEKYPDGSTKEKSDGWILDFPHMESWDHWFYSHAPSEIVYDISGKNYTRFESYFYMANSGCGGATLEVKAFADGDEIYSSGVIEYKKYAIREIKFEIPENANTLIFEVDELESMGCDHYVFGNAKLFTDSLDEELVDKNIPNVDNASVGYTFSADTIYVGDTFTLNINAEKVTDLAGWQFDLAFNPDVLEAVEVNEGDFLKTDGGTIFFQQGTIDNTEGKIAGLSAALISKGGVSGVGTLLSVTFSAKAGGDSQFSLHNYQLGSSSGEVIPADVRDFTITVESKLAWDVNADGQVSVLDLILVAQRVGETTTANSEFDVNDDGIISILDLILVAQHLGESITAAAPITIAIENVKGLNPTTVQEWIAQADAENDGSLAFQQGIANLERLLATLIPEETSLLPNYPNPFNPETWIPYQLSEPAEVTLHIYAVNGAKVRTLALGLMPAGMYQSRSRAAYWDGRNNVGEPVASGVYFYTLTAGNFTATRKMLIVK